MDSEIIKDDEIVISGIGCKLPEMENLPEVIEKLLEGSNLVTKNSEKFDTRSENYPGFEGKINGVENFDNTFFGISNIVCRSMDPFTRLILERAFEAVIDAGINPADLKGTNTSVYSGSSFSPFDLAWETDYKGGYGIMGKNRCMNANRVSYWLDLNGTSVALDGNFANGILNLVNAWEEIRADRCDMAIVSTANLNTPEIMQQLHDLKNMSPDGKCKSFDDLADGWCPAEAIVVFVLQRAKFAKRCYAVIDYALSKCFGDRNDILYKPSQEYWEKILNEFYTKSKINMNNICYVEGQGTGIKEEDAEELNALNSVLCKNRKNPLLVGSIKSNIGHTQAAAASCGILKAIICFESGIIPKNINYNNKNSLAKGKIKIVDENIEMPRDGLIAVNAHGFGGVYAHVVLRGNPKIKKKEFDGIPRLVPLSARTDAFMDEIINKIEKTPIDVEQIALLQDLNSKRMDKYLSRGYAILPKVGDVSVREHAAFGQEKRPVWFIFSGMGGQWTEMGKRMMDLPLFRESIEKSHKILLEKGLDLIHIITTDDPKIFDNILHSFVGIAAIQVALVDILKVLNIVPDFMIGHSVGELGCSYADGCLTAEQTILCAYSRGKASIETELIKGFMAAIGKGYNEIKDELPEGIEVACHNASNSCTLSGPADLVKKYVEELQSRKIFARTVNVANIAYHSQYIKPAAPKLLQYLKDVIPEPKLRSSKWISTSILEENWNTDLAKYCSAEYHTNNLLSSVYFEEGSKHIPDNAICIEIAPHGLLQAILKRSLGPKCTNIPLTNRLSDDPLKFFLQAIGKLYLNGLEPQVHNLYPKINYPCSRGTGPLHQLIRWQHEYEIPILRTHVQKKIMYSLKKHFLKTSEDGIGYIINETNYYPLSVLLHLVWTIFASHQQKPIEDCPVVFENIRTEKPAVINDFEMDQEAYIFVSSASGNFEIIMDHVVVEGYIKLLEDEKENENFEVSEKVGLISKDEIYKELKRRGCVVGDGFQILENLKVNDDVWKGTIPLSADITQTIESMIQLEILRKGNETPSEIFPFSVEKLIIDLKLHSKYKDSLKESNYLETVFQSTANVAKCGGIELKGLKLQEMPKPSLNLKFESKNFEPFMEANYRDLWRFVDFCFSIICENVGDVEMNLIQITNGLRLPSVVQYLEKNFPHLKLNTLTITNGNKPKLSAHHLVISDSQSMAKAVSLTADNGFIFIKSLNNSLPEGVTIITKCVINKEEYVLLRKENLHNLSLIINGKVDFVTMPSNESMLLNVLKEIENSKRITYLVGYKEPFEDFENYKKELQKKFNAQLRWILILDEKAPKFNPANPFYKDELRKGLISNIYKNGSWGYIFKKEFTEDKIIADSYWPESVNNGVIPNYISFDQEGNVIEYSGTLKNKTKVIGIGTIRNNELIPDPHFKWILPPSWNLDDGSTIPLSYALAVYCLKILGTSMLLEKEQRVLVTDGLSCNGIAAVAVGISIGARIFVTVNDSSEVEVIKKLFPKLNESDILTHEDNDFDVQLNFITDGCELVINNLEDEKFITATNCIAFRGRFFHFGKEILKKNTKLGMAVFLTNTSFYSVVPEAIPNLPLEDKIEIRDFIDKGLKNGCIKPLPKTITSPKDIKKNLGNEKNRKKIVIASQSIQTQSDRLKINSENSYVIIGDETNSWLDILKWLLRRNVVNIVINVKNVNIQKAYLRIEAIKRNKNVILRNDGDIVGLLNDARKLGELSAVFLMRMFESNGLKLFTQLDKLYRDPNGHLIIISKNEDSVTEICKSRTAHNFISTNFIWDAQEILSDHALDLIEKISGLDPVIRVSDVKKLNEKDQSCVKILADILPKSIEEFCSLGNALHEKVKLIELPTLGQRNFIGKEVSPLVVIPGLQNDPEKILKPFAKKCIYPVFYAKMSSQYSIRDLATLLLPEVLALNEQRKAFNILGISWGSYIAIELSKLIEESGRNVSLIIINGPLQSLKETLTPENSLKENLLRVIQEISGKELADMKTKNINSTSIDRIAEKIEIPFKNQNEFKIAFSFIYNNLQAMMEYDFSDVKLKGPLTIIKTDQRFKDPLVRMICNNLIVYNVDGNSQEFFNCKKIIDVIHGSCINSSMSDETIHCCSWKKFEDFIDYDELCKIEYSKRLQILTFEDVPVGKTIEIAL